MTVYIYGLYDPRNNALRYIGKTLNLRMRFDLHLSETRCGRESHKNRWLAQLGTLELQPIMRVLEIIENSNDADWQERERWWIEAARECGDPITNLDSGGRNGNNKCYETRMKMKAKATGRVMSKEAIEKMKATKIARLTPEVRERIAAAQRGKKHSEETRAKMAQSRTGYKFSDESKRKIGEANKRRWHERRKALQNPVTPAN